MRTIRPRLDYPSVVHLTAEYWPFARTGGLAEAVRGLASFQAGCGHPTTVLVPLYRSVMEMAPDIEPAGEPFSVQVGPRREEARLLRLCSGGAGPQVFFVENAPYFARSGIYGEAGADYPDNARRFAFFCAVALQQLPALVRGPAVLHAHDWHTALAPVYLRALLAGDPFYDRMASVV